MAGRLLLPLMCDRQCESWHQRLALYHQGLPVVLKRLRGSPRPMRACCLHASRGPIACEVKKLSLSVSAPRGSCALSSRLRRAGTTSYVAGLTARYKAFGSMTCHNQPIMSVTTASTARAAALHSLAWPQHARSITAARLVSSVTSMYYSWLQSSLLHFAQLTSRISRETRAPLLAGQRVWFASAQRFCNWKIVAARVLCNR